MSDAVYDRLFDELGQLERELGVQLGNSPTQTVGWLAVDKLKKVSHPIPLLSLDKTKRVEDLCTFMGDQLVMLMPKLDGLTLKVVYENGIILEASTRGDGDEGENITHNVRGISGIPTKIPYLGRLVVTGEAFIRRSCSMTAAARKSSPIRVPVRMMRCTSFMRSRTCTMCPS